MKAKPKPKLTERQRFTRWFTRVAIKNPRYADLGVTAMYEGWMASARARR